MTIGEVAKETGLRASAIRFYEKAGVLPKPVRKGGQRRYDGSVLERIAVLERARQCGFSLQEVRQLFYGFRPDAPPSERWQALARKKIAELDSLAVQITEMKRMLQQTCACRDLEECGRRIRSTAREEHRRSFRLL